MKITPTRRRRELDADIERQMDDIVSLRIRQTMRAAGLTADSPVRRRCDLLARQVLRMVEGPIDTWRLELLDELLDAQAELRARFLAAELFARMQSSERPH